VPVVATEGDGRDSEATATARTSPLQAILGRADAFQRRHRLVGLVFGVTRKYSDDNAGVLVAYFTYSAFFALFPLLLVLVTVLGLVLSADPRARLAVEHSVATDFPIIGGELLRNVHALRRASVISFVVGIGGLSLGGTSLAQAGLFALAEVWNVPSASRPNYLARLGRSVSFLLLLGVGLAMTTVLASFGTFGRHDLIVGLLGEVASCVVNIGLYLLGFRLLTPGDRPIAQHLPGAIVGGIGWTLLQALGGYLVGHDLRGDTAVYGFFAIVLGLLGWLYFGARLTVYAAELNVVLAEHLWPRSLVHPPYTDADDRAYLLERAGAARVEPDPAADAVLEAATPSAASAASAESAPSAASAASAPDASLS
jgi:uncharacterized BrkB/YihY/UPF0761 family membrane protein